MAAIKVGGRARLKGARRGRRLLAHFSATATAIYRRLAELTLAGDLHPASATHLAPVYAGEPGTIVTFCGIPCDPRKVTVRGIACGGATAPACPLKRDLALYSKLRHFRSMRNF